jgi:hypothetical protein
VSTTLALCVNVVVFSCLQDSVSTTLALCVNVVFSCLQDSVSTSLALCYCCCIFMSAGFCEYDSGIVC